MHSTVERPNGRPIEEQRMYGVVRKGHGEERTIL